MSELAELRRAVRSFGLDWLAAGRFRPTCDAWMRGHDPEFSRAMAAHGWIGITWPREFGGAGRSNLARLVVTEELLRLGAPVAAHWIADRQIGPAILRYGTDELRREFLPRIAAGEVTFCLGMSESEAGSDLAAVRTTAVPDGDGWSLTGRKLWTSHAHRSTHAYVLARTGRGERRHEGLTEFIVDMTAPGVAVRPIIDLAGEHHFNETTFDEVRPSHVLGAVGGGWRQVTEQLAFERGGLERVLSTYPLLAALIDELAGSADVRAVEAVGELVARVATLRELAWDVAGEMDAGRAPVRRAALLKLLGTAFERDVCDVARWVVDRPAEPGAAGLSGLLAQAFLAAPGTSIRGGTNEVLRTLVARGDDQPGPDGMLTEVVRDVLKGSTVDTLWETVRGLGWDGVGLPEPAGSGGTLAELCEIVRVLGGHEVRVPLVEASLARWVLGGDGPDPDGGLTVVALPGRVPSGRVARRLAVPTDHGWWVADAVLASAHTNLAGEAWDEMAVPERPQGTPVTAGPTAVEVEARGALLRAAEMVGAIERVYALTAAHVHTRQQFGRPLADFQAVGHALADLAGERELARAALAAAIATHGTPAGGQRLAAARVVLGRAAGTVSRVAHQLHGAIGIAKEHPLHRFTTRLLAWRDEYGSQRVWSHRLGTAATTWGAERTWAWVTDDGDRHGDG